MSWGLMNNSKIRIIATDAFDSSSSCLVAVDKPIRSDGLSAKVRDGMRIINRGLRVDGPISLWSGTHGRRATPDSMPRGVVTFCERPCLIAFDSLRDGVM